MQEWCAGQAAGKVEQINFSKMGGPVIFAGIKLQIPHMKNKGRAIWALIFLLSAAGLAYAIYSHWSWLTLILPFLATSFVKTFDIM